MAARAGATSVVGVEQSAHMTDVGEECLVRAYILTIQTDHSARLGAGYHHLWHQGLDSHYKL
eukprot:scaffold137324_cov34-Prasinocladus_malaysianus.AAC.1